MNNMERKVGDVFDYDGKQLKVYNEIDECEACYFKYMSSCLNPQLKCGFFERVDKQNIIFVELK